MFYLCLYIWNIAFCACILHQYLYIYIWIHIHMYTSYIKWRFLFRFTLVVRCSHTLCLSAYGLYQISIQKASLTSSRFLYGILFFLFTLEGLLLVCGSGTMHDTNWEKNKFIQIPTQRRQKIRSTTQKIVYQFLFFFRWFVRSFVHSCAICRCNVMKFGSVLRSINFYYDIHCLFSIRFSWCWLLGSMIKLCRIDFSKLMYRYAHLKFIPCSVRFGIRFD